MLLSGLLNSKRYLLRSLYALAHDYGLDTKKSMSWEHVRRDSRIEDSALTQALLDPEEQLSEKHIALPSPRSRTRRYVGQILCFLLPSFIQSRIFPSKREVKPGRIHPTAWLDGVRGVAAFLVCLDHLSYSSHDVYSAWGSLPDKHHEFLKLPFLRAFYTGTFMVANFFVVSGYALSYKPVRLMRNGNWTELQQTLTSSVFRRGMRLYLPCVASTLIIVLLLRLGAYEWTRDFSRNQKYLTNRREAHPVRDDTLSEQLAEWFKGMIYFINPWTFDILEGDRGLFIDGHLWTIPVEFRASLVLYLVQVGFSRLRSRFRILGLLGLMFWVHQLCRWEMILFFGGFLLAELDVARRERVSSEQPGSLSTPQNRWTRLKPAVYIAPFLIGIYLGGQPAHRVATGPGWMTLASLIPAGSTNKARYWPGWGALLLMWSTSNSVLLQKFFTSRFAQYLGQISFAIYLMHGLVIHTIGYATMQFMWTTFGNNTGIRKEGGFAVAAILVVFFAVWAADIFMRLVDTPSVKFAKWLESKLSKRADD